MLRRDDRGLGFSIAGGKGAAVTGPGADSEVCLIIRSLSVNRVLKWWRLYKCRCVRNW